MKYKAIIVIGFTILLSSNSWADCSGIKIVRAEPTVRSQFIGPKLYGYYVKLKNTSNEVKDVYLSFNQLAGWGVPGGWLKAGYHKLRVPAGGFAEENFGGSWANEHDDHRIDYCE